MTRATALGLAASAVAVLAASPAYGQDGRAPDASERGPLSLGVRVGPQSVYLEGAGAPSDLRGYVGGIDGALRLTHHLALAGVLEGSIYDGRTDRLEPGPPATSVAAFAELRIDTNPDGPWTFRIDLGSGYRWLALPLAGSTEAYSGIEALRLRLGPAYRFTDGLEVSVAFGFGVGWFTSRSGGPNCAVTASCPDSLFDSDTESPVHFIGDLTVALRGWP